MVYMAILSVAPANIARTTGSIQQSPFRSKS